ncbi:MAG: hypothetical protein NT169_02770 [Chloroflexi bacterium]|nr:hypothetical protein [Chloroflexota bacterium]
MTQQASFHRDPPFRVRQRRRLGGFLIIGLILALSPAAASAQGGPGDLWQTFTVREGLRSGNVSAVFAAPDGVLWFGADTGVGFYDGHYWQGLGEAEGLPADRVRAITETTDGAVWFATKTAGLGRRSPDGKCCQKWNMENGLPSNDVRALLPATVSPDGNGEPGIWVGTAQGLIYLDGERQVRNSPLADATVLAMTAGTDGAILVATSTTGVWERNRNGAWQALDGTWPAAAEIFTLWAEKDGRVWAGTQNGLFFYEAGIWQQFPLLTTDSGPAVFALLQDEKGGLWAGTDQGLFYSAAPRADNPTLTQLRARQNGLVNDYVRAMAFTPDGALWLGTIAGISRYAGHIWQTVEDDGLAGQRINAILTDSRGKTWVGTEQGGLAVWDGREWQRLTEREGLPDRRIVSLFEDSRGWIWVGTGNDVGYLAADGKWRFFGRAAIGVDLPVYSFAQDADGPLWLAAGGGAVRWDETGGFQPAPELAGKRVNAVHRGRDGALWFGLPDDGVKRLLPGAVQGQATWETALTAGGSPLKGIVVNGIEDGPAGSLWVGTGNDGLWRYADGSWQRLDAELPSPKVLTLSYGAESLWIGTYAGLSRFDGRTWQSYAGDVLPNSKVLAVASDAAGVIWIGTEGGLVRYQPERTTPWVKVESVNLQALRNGAITLSDGQLQAIRLDAGDLGTRFDHLLFLVQLEGVDAAERVLTEPFVSFDDLTLTPGSYVLRVQVRDADFNYSAPAEITLAVPPPKPMVTLPGGRRMATGDFLAIVLLGLVALGGLGGAGGIALRARARERRREAEMTARGREALSRQFNPYICGEPVRQAEMFFARDELLNKIFSALHQNSVMIHGERRMGKTSLLYQLTQRLRQADDPEWVFVPVLIDLEGTPQEHFFHHLMDGIWAVLAAYLVEAPPELRFSDKPVAEYNDRYFTSDLRLLLDALKTVVAPRNVRVILLLDEMDVVSHYDNLIQQQLRRVFMSSLAENLGAVVAGVHISKAWDRLESPWYNLFNDVELEPFTPANARELLTEPVKGTYTWAPDALAFTIDQAEGRPFRLQQYGLEAVNQMLAGGRTHITLADAQAAHRAIEKAGAT